jgi:hypothetical protein
VLFVFRVLEQPGQLALQTLSVQRNAKQPVFPFPFFQAEEQARRIDLR